MPFNPPFIFTNQLKTINLQIYVKVVYFGPSEKMIVEDPILSDQAQDIAEAGGSIACKYISDRDGVSEKIEKLGVQVEYVGNIVSDLIKDGYIPMVW